ncbi:hypothetical protein EDB89DRAFT_744784 [Lactarius sanguifluus]|nr:hypothetical protein EDB89DRAFT_744784 [Lactarius sanguifluus]
MLQWLGSIGALCHCTPGSLPANACPAPCTAFVIKRHYLGYWTCASGRPEPRTMRHATASRWNVGVSLARTAPIITIHKLRL